jgi:hypothetical protein
MTNLHNADYPSKLSRSGRYGESEKAFEYRMSIIRSVMFRAALQRRNAARRLRERREIPLGRQHTDGATSDQQVSRWILWLAEEWKLHPDDVAKAVKCSTYEMSIFARKALRQF